MLAVQLRNEFANIDEILSDNMEYVKNIYNRCLEQSFNDEISDQDSHNAFCAITAICLINDCDDVEFPVRYNDQDFDLMAKVMASIDLLMTVEAMADKNIIERRIIDGKIYYSARD